MRMAVAISGEVIGHCHEVMPTQFNQTDDRFVYTREQLLAFQSYEQMLKTSISSFTTSLPITAPYSPEELEARLLRAVRSGDLPPRGWHCCGVVSQRAALLAALRGGHMQSVYAMQPESDQFREQLNSTNIDSAFLMEAMQILCEDAAASGLDCPDGRHVPAVAWLLERGAPVGPLLPAGRSKARVGGFGLLRELGKTANVTTPEILDCFTDDDPHVRRAAANMMGHFGAQKADAQALVDALARSIRQDSNPQVREATAEALGSFEVPEALREAGRMLDDSDIEVRGLAASALRFAGGRAEIYIPTLVSWLNGCGDAPEAYAIGSTVNPRSALNPRSQVHVVVDAARQATLRALAARALGRIVSSAERPPATESAVFAALASALREDNDEHVREAAADALGYMAKRRKADGSPIDDVAMEALIGALDDEDHYVRQVATSVLEYTFDT